MVVDNKPTLTAVAHFALLSGGVYASVHKIDALLRASAGGFGGWPSQRSIQEVERDTIYQRWPPISTSETRVPQTASDLERLNFIVAVVHCHLACMTDERKLPRSVSRRKKYARSRLFQDHFVRS